MSTTQNRTADAQPQSMTPFWVIFSGQGLSLFGSALVQFALVRWLTKTTGPVKVLASASVMAVLPRVLIGPFAGALVDRWSRRLVMIVADGVVASTVVVLAVLYALGAAQVWHIYLVMFVRATGGAFHWPAMRASTSLMVPVKHLPRVGGFHETLLGISSMGAPPLGALLLEVLPMQGILAIDVVTAILAMAPLFFIHIPQPKAKARTISVLADMRDGLRFVLGWRGLAIALTVATLLNMLRLSTNALRPILVTDHFGGGAIQLAWMQSAWAIGAVAGGLALGAWGGFKRRMVTGVGGMALSGAGILMVGLAPPDALGFAIGATFFVALGNGIGSGAFFAMLQTVVPPGLQGRVLSLTMSAAWAAQPVGLVIAGVVGEAVGVPVFFTIAGVSTIVGFGSMFLVPSVLYLEDEVAVRAPVAT